MFNRFDGKNNLPIYMPFIVLSSVPLYKPVQIIFYHRDTIGPLMASLKQDVLPYQHYTRNIYYDWNCSAEIPAAEEWNIFVHAQVHPLFVTPGPRKPIDGPDQP